MKENKEQLRSAEGHSPDYVKGFNDAIDQALMLMQINPWHADEKITRGYAYAVHDKAKEIHRMRFASQFKPSGVKTEWIDVKDRLPEMDYEVIVCEMKFGRRSPNVMLGWISGNTKKWAVANWYGITHDCENNADYYEITHWMELPEPPK